MNLDHRLSQSLAAFVRGSRVRSRLAVLGASELVWLMIGAALVLAWTGDEPNRVLRLGAFMGAVGFAWAVTLLVELLFKRARPFQQKENEPLIHMLFVTPSFPSGHATVAFAVAASMSHLAPGYAAAFFVGAAVVSFCRVAVGVHFVSDVVAGAIVGTLVALLVV